MSRTQVNLAARPFANSRPVRRVAILLWVLGGLLFVANLVAFWGYYTGSSDIRDQLAAVSREVAEERARVRELENALRQRNVTAQNLRASFLNAVISARTFGWSELFDRLGELLPRDVRLHRLNPNLASVVKGGRLRPDAATSPEQVELELEGDARSDEVLYELVDALYADPAFERPLLARESLREGLVGFSLSVLYRPDVVAASLEEETAEGGEAAAAEAGGEVAAGEDAAGGATPAVEDRTAGPEPGDGEGEAP